MKKSQGFTLIEVIIVVAIIGIMAAISIPAISSWLPNYRLKAAARELYAAAMKAKGEAVKRNTNCALTFNQTVGGVANAYVVYVDANSDCEFNAGDTVIMQVPNLPKQVSFDTSQGGGDGLSFVNNGATPSRPTIVFKPNAIPTAYNLITGTCSGVGNGSAFLTNTNGHTKTVVINQAGRIKIN